MAENVMVIPARRRVGNRQKTTAEKPKLRVAAYCRVSTESEEQAGSYEMQVAHYKQYIEGNPDWELAGIYADDGISGTNTKKREEFNRMIDDCMAGKIDKVITKSISRFARNTIDCLKYVRQLREKNIEIIFEKENIKTLEASGELLLTIMASLAQQESASISQNVKMGIQFRFQEGKTKVNHNYFLGYTKDENGELVIVDEEAAVVKRIFREFLEGATLREISSGLEADHILTGAKKAKWHLSTIVGILQNEKYIGDALLQKTITTDFIEKTRIKNDGTLPQYYVRDSHEAIIPRDIFTLAQEELKRRNNIMGTEGEEKKRVYSGKYALSHICTCGNCGAIYRRVVWNNHGKKRPVWRCLNRLSEGPEVCDATTVEETDLQNAVVATINQVVRGADAMKEVLMENIKTVLVQDDTAEFDALSQELIAKQKELIDKKLNDEEAYQLEAEVDELMEQKQAFIAAGARREGFKNRVKELEAFIDQQKQITEYDESLVRMYIDGIKVYEDRFTVSFKAGIEIEIAR